MKLELISFKLCPFVQRSVITLLHKDQPFETTFINLMDPPDWFSEISPLGKVPLLRVDDTVLFESAVINEFIDEVTPDRLMPEDP
ncbi:MAG: glutathione S-transferase family protein, partial [Halothiobacillaceae bacterium]